MAYYKVDDAGASRLMLSYVNPDALDAEPEAPALLVDQIVPRPRKRQAAPPPRTLDRACRWVVGLFYA